MCGNLGAEIVPKGYEIRRRYLREAIVNRQMLVARFKATNLSQVERSMPAVEVRASRRVRCLRIYKRENGKVGFCIYYLTK